MYLMARLVKKCYSLDLSRRAVGTDLYKYQSEYDFGLMY